MVAPAGPDHQVCLFNREKLEVSGVRKVESFNEQSVLLETSHGSLQVKGTGLHVNQLSLELEQLQIEGHVDAISYTASPQRITGKGFLTRLLK